MKHLVTVVDANDAHRRAVSEALFSFYSVAAFADSANAISGILLAPPVLILVGQRVGTGSGANFIRDLRKEAALAQIPVIFVLDSEDIRVLALSTQRIDQRHIRPDQREATKRLEATPPAPEKGARRNNKCVQRPCRMYRGG